MATLTCPYCYHQQPTAELHFVCDGQGAPGWEACVPRRDDQRERRTGYNREAMPTFPAVRTDGGGRRGLCPYDGSWSAKRACSLCHTPLPTSLVDRPSPLIGMVGGTAAGKTVFLTVLNRQLRSVISDRFDADVHLVGEQQAGSNSIHEWLRIHERSLFTDKLLPAQTPPSPTGRRMPLVLEWRHPKRTAFPGWRHLWNAAVRGRPRPWRTTFRRVVHPPTILSFCDAAGEDILSQEAADRQRYLKAAGGLIILLDAYQIPGVRSEVALPPAAQEEVDLVDSVLAVVSEAIKGGGGHGDKITTPVAVVVAKLDVIEHLLDPGHFLRTREPRNGGGYDDQFGADMHEHVRTLLRTRGAGPVDRHLAAGYTTYRYFAMSSLGALPDNERNQVNKRGVRPKFVAEPLLWLMHLNGIIEKVGRA